MVQFAIVWKQARPAEPAAHGCHRPSSRSRFPRRILGFCPGRQDSGHRQRGQDDPALGFGFRQRTETDRRASLGRSLSRLSPRMARRCSPKVEIRSSANGTSAGRRNCISLRGTGIPSLVFGCPRRADACVLESGPDDPTLESRHGQGNPAGSKDTATRSPGCRFRRMAAASHPGPWTIRFVCGTLPRGSSSSPASRRR